MTSDPDTAALSRIERLIEIGRYAAAKDELIRHLATEPDSPEALCWLARCELGLGRPDRAEQAAQAALVMTPDSEWALQLLALAAGEVGHVAEALSAAQRAVHIAPNLWSTHQILAQTLLLDPQQRSQAYDAALRAVELAPTEPAAHITVGLAAEGIRRRDLARQAYEEALRHDPNDPIALNNLAVLDLGARRTESAAQRLIGALRLDPNAALMQRNLDFVALRLLERLLNVLLLGGVVMLLVLVLEIAGVVPRVWVRALVGAVLLAAYLIVARSTLRHLPRGARRHLRGVPRRLRGRASAIMLLWAEATIVFAIAAFVPAAASVGMAMLVGVICAAWAFVLAVEKARAVAQSPQ